MNIKNSCDNTFITIKYINNINLTKKLNSISQIESEYFYDNFYKNYNKICYNDHADYVFYGDEEIYKKYFSNDFTQSLTKPTPPILRTQSDEFEQHDTVEVSFIKDIEKLKEEMNKYPYYFLCIFTNDENVIESFIKEYNFVEIELIQPLNNIHLFETNSVTKTQGEVSILSKYFVEKDKEYSCLEYVNDITYRKNVYVINKNNSIDDITNDQEYIYLNLLKKILCEGKFKENRTGQNTLSLFGESIEFNLSGGYIPLLTTKKMFFRGIVEELLFFLSGKTNVKILQDKNVHIWDGNSSREYLDSIGLEYFEEGDLGKFYGFQWRHWGSDYTNCYDDYTNKGFDQIQNVINTIKNNPDSRRIIITTWNPSDLNKVCLPPCHVLYQFYVDKKNKTLSCNMYQRSADMFLGVPFNIASCSLLTYMIANETNLEVEKVRVNFGDAHIYTNHINQCLEQINKEPLGFPKINIQRTSSMDKNSSLYNYTYEDFKLVNYNHLGRLKANMVV